MAMMAEAKAPQFAEEGFFEYHIYDLQRKTTIKDKQTKQISLLEAAGIKAEKELLVYGVQSFFTQLFYMVLISRVGLTETMTLIIPSA